MATENELLGMMDELRNAVQGLGDVVKDDTGFFKSLGEELGGTSKTLKQTRADLGKHLGASLKDAGNNLTNFALQVGRGDTTFASLNGVVDTATDAIAGLAKAIPYAGEVLAAGIKAAGEASKYVLAEMQDVTNTFKELGSVGALTATGMTGLQDQFLKSRMTMEGYKKVVMENAGALARFGGIAGEGAERFSKAVGDIIDNQGDELRKLGYGADQIGQVAAGFLKQQTLLGKQNQLTQDQLRAGSVAYARELDELAKLTGANRSDLQKAQDDMLRDSKFLANQMLLEQEGRGLAAKQIRDFALTYKDAAPMVMKGLMDLSSGVTNTAESIALQQASPEALSIMERLKNNQIDHIQASTELQRSMKGNEQAMLRHMSLVGDTSGVYIKMADAAAVANGQFTDDGKVRRLLTETTDAQINKTDTLTKQVIGAEKELEALSRQMKMFAIELMPYAANAVREFTHYVREFINFARDAISGESKGYDWGAVAGAAAKYGTAGAGAGAGIGAMGFGVGAGPGALIGGTIGTLVGGGSELANQYFGKKTTSPGGFGNMGMGGSCGSMPVGQRPEDLLVFGSGTGSRQNFDQLEPALRERVLAAAAEYYQTSGKKLEINSGFRSLSEQANVNSGGRPKAEPGKSAHNFGAAVDINNYRDPAAVRALNNQGLFQKVQGDAPHFSMQYGGVVTGPKSGYRGMLHGPEAVIPLAGGRSVPVEMPAFTGSLQEQIGLLSDNNSLLSELIGLMSNNNSISSKILQASRG
jgi:hypothetical protein